MTDKPFIKNHPPPFTVRCARCPTTADCDSMMDLGLAMNSWYAVRDNVLICPSCYEAVVRVRQPHLDAAYEAMVAEINAYKDAAGAAPVLSMIDNDKGEVH